MLASKDQFDRASALQEGFFILPDVGDILGALLMQDAGFPAVGTTSVGLGFAHGCPSTHAVSRDVMLESVSALCKAVRVPLFVDLEQGYADTPEGVGEVAREVLRAGAVGFNIEDSDGIPGAPLRSAEAHAERIAAARAAAGQEGVPALITGRTDTFWLHTDMSEEEKTAEAIRRANLYLQAGAESIFISGRKAIPATALARLVKEIKGQVNTLLSAGGPTIPEIRALGVRRLQTGSLAVRAQSGFLREGFGRILQDFDSSLLDQYAVPTPQLNKLADQYWNR